MLKQINFLRLVEQFKDLSKRVLTKIFNSMVSHNVIRGQVLFKEGEEVQHVYIVEEGEIEIKKNVY